MKEILTTLMDKYGQEYTGKIFVNDEWIDAPAGTKRVVINAEDYPKDMPSNVIFTLEIKDE